MAIQYKPTKPKKEKSPKEAKAPKAPKAEKPMKIGSVQKVKTTKPAKAPKAPKAPKAEKAMKVNKLVKAPKAEKAVKLETGAESKKISPKQYIVTAIVMVGILVVAILATAVVGRIQEYGEQAASILVSTPPKLEYRVGDKPRYDGLKLQVVLNNGDSYFVDGSECEFSGFDSSKAVERQTITVSYKGLTCTYKIQIVDVPKPAPVLKNIYLEKLPITEYKVGQWLSVKDGVLMVEYEDGTYMRHNLTYDDVFNFVIDPIEETYVTQKPGTYELEIRYRVGKITKTTTYTITVTE